MLKSVDSTNNEAKRMTANGFRENALIVANEQTKGRGRLGREFYSPKNTGIYMSFLLSTDVKISDAVQITTATAVAVVRAIESLTDLRPMIKWVNDVYLGNKKVCGILTEAVTDFETGLVKAIKPPYLDKYMIGRHGLFTNGLSDKSIMSIRYNFR